MKSENIDIQKFDVKMGAVEFRCIFSTRTDPYTLSLTTRGERPTFFKFEVKRGYNISEYFSEYRKLGTTLRLDGRSDNKLYPSVFLKQLNQQIPHTASAKQVPSSEEIVKLRPDIEEGDKPYFNTWAALGKGPTEKNLHKTREVLGNEAYQYSQDIKHSSVWSATYTGRSWKR